MYKQCICTLNACQLHLQCTCKVFTRYFKRYVLINTVTKTYQDMFQYSVIQTATYMYMYCMMFF